MIEINWDEYESDLNEEEKEEIIKDEKSKQVMEKMKEKIKKRLKEFSKQELRYYALYNGLKFGGTKKRLIEEIYQKEGQGSKLLKLEPGDVIKRERKEKKKWEDKLLINELGKEIQKTMQHDCMNFTTNCIFGKFKRSTFNKYWDHESMYFNRKIRKVDGQRKRELWVKQTYTNNFPKFMSNYVINEYYSYDMKEYCKSRELFVMRGRRKYRNVLKELTIKFNYHREFMVFDTKWDRFKKKDDMLNWQKE